MTSHGQDAPQNGAVAIVGGAVNPIVVPPNDRIELVEFVEIVDRGQGLGAVKNPGPKREGQIEVTTRTDKDGDNYKQYINLGKDIDGPDQRHPEYGQYIEFRAKVKWEEAGKVASLEGREVWFTSTRKNGKGRPDPLRDNKQKDGFSLQPDADRLASHSVKTDQDGWTPTVRFYLSQYGGDKYEIHAQAEEELHNIQPTGEKKTIGTYEVWRKFWYQVTRPTNLTLPSLDKAKSAWAKVKADMVAGDENTFNINNLPAGPAYPKWMLKGGQSEDKRLVIGGGNKQDFYGMFDDQNDKPVQIHLITCHVQADVMPTNLTTAWTTKTEFDHVVDSGGIDAVVSPKLAGGHFVLNARVRTRCKENGQWVYVPEGNIPYQWPPISANCFTLCPGRSSKGKVHIDLTNDANVNNMILQGHQVRLYLQVEGIKTWAGESNGHHVICSQSTPGGLFVEKFFNSTIVHEIGHSFGQVPKKNSERRGLPPHPNYYDEAHGGHCRHGLVSRCTMHAGGLRMPTTFCSVCNKYVRLRDMSHTVPVT